MADPNGDASKVEKPNSEVVTTRVNVAFPFSQIKVQEPSKDLTELAGLVRELTDVLTEVAPGPKTADLRQTHGGTGDSAEVSYRARARAARTMSRSGSTTGGPARRVACEEHLVDLDGQRRTGRGDG